MPQFPPPAARATGDVRVVPVDAALAPAVRLLRVTPEQDGFVGDIEFNLDDARRDPSSEAMAIVADNVVIGFYRLDCTPNAIVGRPLGQPHIGLRAFLIDRGQQGRGLGQRAVRACCADIQRRYSHHRLIALTVDQRNLAALAMYRRAGFRDGDGADQPCEVGGQRLLLFDLGGDRGAPLRKATTPSQPTLARAP